MNKSYTQLKVLFRIPFTYYFVVLEKPLWADRWFLNIANKEFDYDNSVYYYKCINGNIGFNKYEWTIHKGV